MFLMAWTIIVMASASGVFRYGNSLSSTISEFMVSPCSFFAVIQQPSPVFSSTMLKYGSFWPQYSRYSQKIRAFYLPTDLTDQRQFS